MRLATIWSRASRGVTMSAASPTMPPAVWSCRKASSASSSSFPSASSDRSIVHAEKSILYVISRDPVIFAPSTPWLSDSFRDDTADSPARAKPPECGVTQGMPVAMILSPALTCSTISSRTMTSSDRGSEPAGISSGASWTRTRCQSAKRLRSIWSCHLFMDALLHCGFRQIVGVVKRSCCSTSGASRPHFKHKKLPISSSGRTSDVRVTTARHRTSVPILSHRRSRSLSASRRKFFSATKNVRESTGSAWPGRRSSPAVRRFRTSRYARFAPARMHDSKR
mmetsp:Transcript_21609/g.66407  ORF Transcript_21609/g.66407 Transcript_21609/m.66407 type:complete len:281 (-) Transcript_21609:448-1290(-)